MNPSEIHRVQQRLENWPVKEWQDIDGLSKTVAELERQQVRPCDFYRVDARDLHVR